jgi:hypothetical protein
MQNNQDTSHLFYTSGSAQHLQKIANELVGYEGQVLPLKWQNTYIRLLE